MHGRWVIYYTFNHKFIKTARKNTSATCCVAWSHVYCLRKAECKQRTWHWRNVKSAAKRPLPKVNPGSLALWPTNLQDGKCNWNSNGSNCSIRFGMPGPIPASQRFHALDAAIDTQQSQNPQGLCDPQATRLWDGHGDLSSKVGLQMPWSQITGVMWWWFHRGLWRRISSMCCGLRL